MQIGITNPLRQFLRWKPFPPNAHADLFYCWDAHRVRIGGRIMLVVCNAANRAMAVQAMRASDWKHLEQVIPALIKQGLQAEGLPQKVIDRYLAAAGPVEFTRTHGSKPLGNMNFAISDMLVWNVSQSDTQFQDMLTVRVNDMPCHSANHDGYGYAMPWFLEDLKARGLTEN